MILSKPKISIILPSYNVFPYIQQCIESVINQTISNTEIICVDAGSTDGTLEVLMEYAKIYSNVKLILSDKKSYGHQMNLGLSVAKGEYIGIVETDDYIKPEMYEKLYNLSDDGSIDIVKGNFIHFNDSNPDDVTMRVDESKQNLPSSKFTIFDNANILDGHPSIWGAIYKNKFLKDNGIMFMEAPKGGWVDNPFLFETFSKAKSIIYTEEPFYFYRESNPDSSSNNLDDLTLPYRRMLNNMDVLDKYCGYNENILAALYIRIFWHINDLRSKDNFKKNEVLLDYYLKNILIRMDGDIVKRRLNIPSNELYDDYCSKFNIDKSYHENKYKISIIMPIYNAEDVLEQSINSVINQTLDDIELVCIDDGSVDNSINILNEYSEKYDFIKVYSQKNQGSGKARNLGMNLANGQYIGFLDADDFFMENNALERLYDYALNNDANMVTGNIKHDIDNPGEFLPFRNMEYYTEDKVILPEEYGMPWSFYKCIFKKEFLLYNNIYFPDLLRGQDPVFLAEILTKVDEIYAVAVDVYAYVFYDAINRCDQFRKLHDQLLHYKIVFDYFKEPKFNKTKLEFRKAFFWFVGHLNDGNIEDALNILRDIYKDDVLMLNDVENYFYLKYGYNSKFDNIFESFNYPIISAIVPLDDIKEDLDSYINLILNNSFNNLEIIFVSNSKSSIGDLNNKYCDDVRIKGVYSNSDDFDDLLYSGFCEALSEWCFFVNPNHEIHENTFLNLLDFTVINDGGYIFNKSNLDYYYNNHRLVRNLNSTKCSLNEVIYSLNNRSIKNPKVSLIIPVYNAELFLEEALDSVINQTFEDIELVCVNDGSKDNSLAMLIEYAKSDFRFKIINQVNAGCGAARNRALDEANGEFIYFFDPDDYISQDTFERLYANAMNNNSDLVMFKIARFVEGEPVNYGSPGFDFDNVFKDVDFENFAFNYHDIKHYVMNASFAPWTKLYRKDFLDSYDDFRFPTDVAFDDTPFHIQSVLRASSISFVPDFFYYYRFNPNSINNTSSNGIDIFRICDIVEKFLKENNFYHEFENEFGLFKITQIFNYLESTGTNEYFNKAKEEFAKLNISDNNLISPFLSNKVNAVLESNSLYDYIKKDFEKTIDDLNNTNKRLLDENLLLTSKLNNSNVKFSELSDENQKLSSKLTDTNKIVSNLSTENRELSNKLNNSDEIIFGVSNEKNNLISKLNDSNDLISKLTQENKLLLSRLYDSNKKMSELADENFKLSIQIQNLTKKITINKNKVNVGRRKFLR